VRVGEKSAELASEREREKGTSVNSVLRPGNATFTN
jgi:hypothetical protein